MDESYSYLPEYRRKSGASEGKCFTNTFGKKSENFLFHLILSLLPEFQAASFI